MISPDVKHAPEIATVPTNELFSELEWQEIRSNAKKFGALVGDSIGQLNVRGDVITTSVQVPDYITNRTEWTIAESGKLTSLINYVKTIVETKTTSKNMSSLPLRAKVARHAGSLVLTPLGTVTGAAEVYPGIVAGNATMLGVGLGIMGISSVTGIITDKIRRRARIEEYASRLNQAISVEGLQNPQNANFVMKYTTTDYWGNKIIMSKNKAVIKKGDTLDDYRRGQKGIVTQTDNFWNKGRILSIDFTKWFDKSVFNEPAPADDAVFAESWSGALGETVKSIQPLMERLENAEKNLEYTKYLNRLERNLIQEEINSLSDEIVGIIVDYETSHERAKSIRKVKNTAETITREMLGFDEQAQSYGEGTNAFTRGIAHVTSMVSRIYWTAKPHPIADEYRYTWMINRLFNYAEDAMLLVKDPVDDSDDRRIYDPDIIVRKFHATIIECINDYPGAMLKPATVRSLKDFDRFYAMYFDEHSTAYVISPDPKTEGRWPLLPAQNREQ